jgi:hypothetical protein
MSKSISGKKHQLIVKEEEEEEKKTGRKRQKIDNLSLYGWIDNRCKLQSEQDLLPLLDNMFPGGVGGLVFEYWNLKFWLNQQLLCLSKYAEPYSKYSYNTGCCQPWCHSSFTFPNKLTTSNLYFPTKIYNEDDDDDDYDELKSEPCARETIADFNNQTVHVHIEYVYCLEQLYQTSYFKYLSLRGLQLDAKSAEIINNLNLIKLHLLACELTKDFLDQMKWPPVVKLEYCTSATVVQLPLVQYLLYATCEFEIQANDALYIRFTSINYNRCKGFVSSTSAETIILDDTNASGQKGIIWDNDFPNAENLVCLQLNNDVESKRQWKRVEIHHKPGTYHCSYFSELHSEISAHEVFYSLDMRECNSECLEKVKDKKNVVILVPQKKEKDISFDTLISNEYKNKFVIQETSLPCTLCTSPIFKLGNPSRSNFL